MLMDIEKKINSYCSHEKNSLPTCWVLLSNYHFIPFKGSIPLSYSNLLHHLHHHGISSEHHFIIQGNYPTYVILPYYFIHFLITNR